MHHTAALPALSALFDAYGQRPAWAQRHAAALAALWQRRLEITEQFTDA